MNTPAENPSFRRMYARFNRPFERIFRRRVEHVEIPQADKAHLKSLGEKSKIVYVLKQASLLEFNFFSALLKKEQLPIAGYAPQIKLSLLFWLPFKVALRGFLSWMGEHLKTLRFGDLFAHHLPTFIKHESPLLLALTPEYRPGIFGQQSGSSELLETLLETAEREKRNLAFVPLHYIYDYRAEKKPSKWVAFLTDYRFHQWVGFRLLYFLWGSRKMGALKLGTPIEFNAEAGTKANPLLLERELSHAFDEERLRLAGPELRTPRDLYRGLRLDSDFAKNLAAFDTGQGEAALQREAEHLFFEMAADIHPSYVDFYDLLLRRVFKTLYRPLSIDPKEIETIRALSGKSALVFVPNHRSHADYLLLSYILYEHHMTPPHVCAGINLKFWPVGYFFRRGGAFFIQRHISSDSLYAFILKSYLSSLIRRGYSTEFFIEGTRSRTGKLLKPKTGLLKFICEAFVAHPEPDLHFVPVSITYDKVPEEKAYTDEKAGKEKKSESMGDLLHLSNFLKSHHGEVHVKFADPISLSEFLSNEEEGDGSLSRPALSALATRICHGINQNLVVTASSLVAMAFLEQSPATLSSAEVIDRVLPLLHYLRYRRRPLSPRLKHAPRAAILEALDLLTRAKTLHVLEDSGQAFYALDPLKRPALDYYKNNSIHFLSSIACIAKIILKSPRKPLFISAIAQEFDRLKELLANEFTFSLRVSSYHHAEEILDYCLSAGFLSSNRDHRVTLETDAQEKNIRRFANLLNPFLESYWLALVGIETLSFEHLHRKGLAKKMIEMGQVKLLREQIRLAESLNTATLENALAYFCDRGFIRSAEGTEGRKGRDFYSKLPPSSELIEERTWIEGMMG